VSSFFLFDKGQLLQQAIAKVVAHFSLIFSIYFRLVDATSVKRKACAGNREAAHGNGKKIHCIPDANPPSLMYASRASLARMAPEFRSSTAQEGSAR
jgi:hypothetical protein